MGYDPQVETCYSREALHLAACLSPQRHPLCDPELFLSPGSSLERLGNLVVQHTELYCKYSKCSIRRLRIIYYPATESDSPRSTADCRHSIFSKQPWESCFPLPPGQGSCFVLFCFVLFCFVLFFGDRVSLYSPGCPGTNFVDQAGLELRNLPASAS